MMPARTGTPADHQALLFAWLQGILVPEIGRGGRRKKGNVNECFDRGCPLCVEYASCSNQKMSAAEKELFKRKMAEIDKEGLRWENPTTYPYPHIDNI